MSADSPVAVLYDAAGNALLNQKAMTGSVPVVIASDQSAVPVSATALPLPSGAATSVKQPAIGTAGTPSADVISVQGVVSGTALPVSATQLPASLGQKLAASSLPVVMSSDQAPLVNFTTNGTISALNGTVSVAAQGYNSAMIVITGTWSGSLVFEISADGGTTWVAGAFVVPPAVLAPMPLPFLSITANGTYEGIGLGAVTDCRVRASVYSSGPVGVRIVLATAVPGLFGSFTSIQQNALVSIYNNSTANLAAAATFTGSSESTLGVNAIRINLKADQPCRVQLQQSTDGTNWDISDSYILPPGVGDGRTFQATGSFYRVLVTNIGGATTTYLRLQSILCPVVEALPRALGPNGGLLVEGGLSIGTWLPATPGTFDGLEKGTRAPLTLGPDGSLQCYSQILTDAGSFREDYPGTSLQNNLTGTMYFTNGSVLVTGVGTSFTTQINRFSFIKLTGHADTVLNSVVAVDNDSTLTLSAPYAGATGNGVGINSFWFPTVGTGGAISVANSLNTFTSGTTAGSNTWVQRGADYGPMEKTIRFSVSQRIANQTIRMGFVDDFVNPTQQACVELTGTDNTKVTLVTRSSASASDVESVTATLPTGINTASLINLRVDFHPDRVTLLFDPTEGSGLIFLAMCKVHIPAPYVELISGHGILNGTTPASTTTLNVDLVYLNDYNLVSSETDLPEQPISVPAVVSSVSAAVSDTLLLAANKFRNMASLFNNSNSVCYVKLGTGASPTSFTVRMTSNAFYELPNLPSGQGVYTGVIDGYWASANGAMLVTEM